MEDLKEGRFCCLEHGSTHISLGIYGRNGPEEILLGEERELSGRVVKRGYFPTALIFTREPPDQPPDKILDEGTGIELAGFPSTTNEEAVYGIKQALDEDLCQPGSLGESLRTRLAKYGPVDDVLDDCLAKYFRYGRERLEEHRKSKRYDRPLQKVFFAVPAKQTRGKKGREAQDQIRRCAIRAGFPADAIDFRSEMEAAAVYDDYLERMAKKDAEPSGDESLEPPRKKILVNMGGAVMDITAVEMRARTFQLLRTSVSCGGGILNVLGELREECRGLRPGTFRLLEQHVFGMGETLQDYPTGERTFRGADLGKKMFDCYDGGLSLVEGLIWKFPDVGEIRDRFCRLRSRMQEAGHSANFEVTIPAEDVAAKAVPLGGCIPFMDNAALRFHQLCFGFLTRVKFPRKREQHDTLRSQNGKESRGDKWTRGFLQEVKKPYTDDLEKHWEPLRSDGKRPNELKLDPYTISDKDWKPLDDCQSLETYRPVGPATCAMPMGRIRVDLKRRVKPNQRIWIRFKRKDEELYPTLYILQVDCRKREWYTPDPDPDKDECVEVALELVCDSERCFFVPVDGQQYDSDDDEEEGEDEQRQHRKSGRKDQRVVPNSPSRKSQRIRKRKERERQITGPFAGPFLDEEEVRPSKTKKVGHRQRVDRNTQPEEVEEQIIRQLTGQEGNPVPQVVPEAEPARPALEALQVQRNELRPAIGDAREAREARGIASEGCPLLVTKKANQQDHQRGPGQDMVTKPSVTSTPTGKNTLPGIRAMLTFIPDAEDQQRTLPSPFLESNQ